MKTFEGFNVFNNLKLPYPPNRQSRAKIDGDKAVGRAYWFHYGNNNPERRAVLDGYGHYADEMVKVDVQWLFSKRVT